MTQIRVNPQRATPQTHVLIIGVGHYRHLRGGQFENGAHMGLRVLTSPPVSAMSIARWILSGDGITEVGLHNPSAPLGTLEVLISAAQNEQLDHCGTNYNIERASLPNVKLAFDRWLTEIKQHPNNIGMIYFCGHGITGTRNEQILLLDDHGESENRPFETGSFDLSNTIRALCRKVEAPLYVFVDACRTYADEFGMAIGSNPDALLHDGVRTKYINTGLTHISSATDNKSAYGSSNEISRFTAALRMALTGYCGDGKPGTRDWFVNGHALSMAMPKLLDLMNRESRNSEPQLCNPYTAGTVDAPLHVINHLPIVKVEIELSPEQHCLNSHYEIRHSSDQSIAAITGGKTKGVWKAETPKGIYEVKICSQHDQEHYKNCSEHLDPPLFRLPLEVQP
ncbi:MULTISPECIES: caspase family protein [Thalassospira]|jgi:hypothetical protein|nr:MULTISPECIES: caspase family protein [Thalassospira]MAL28380.1 hypothetical protein [Thalassospira sp.]HIO02677.1 caspase family protein [Alphaproteobacteria bacterium]MBL4843827.1 caspase family protein [Thalassospira sp.]MCD1592433.1 caspase family protein [Thalassospira xiamenensis]MCK2168457.1 caspase family protein [Thalassospira xiamenensis]